MVSPLLNKDPWTTPFQFFQLCPLGPECPRAKRAEEPPAPSWARELCACWRPQASAPVAGVGAWWKESSPPRFFACAGMGCFRRV